MRRTIILMAALLVGFMFLNPMHVSATAPTRTEVFGPTAAICNTWGVDIVGSGEGVRLDGYYAHMRGDFAYIRTSDYTLTNYVNYWTPWANRTAFPPANATFNTLSIIVIYRNVLLVSSDIKLEFSYWNGTGLLIKNQAIHHISASLFVIPHIWEYNVTSFVPSLNITALTNHTGHLSTYIVQYGAASQLDVDYIGVAYNWTAAPVIPGGPSSPSVFSFNIIGIMGAFGFIGMIGVPAIAIWFYKHEGGTRIGIAVGALTGFVFCFALFLVSITP